MKFNYFMQIGDVHGNCVGDICRHFEATEEEAVKIFEDAKSSIQGEFPLNQIGGFLSKGGRRED